MAGLLLDHSLSCEPSLFSLNKTGAASPSCAVAHLVPSFDAPCSRWSLRRGSADLQSPAVQNILPVNSRYGRTVVLSALDCSGWPPTPLLCETRARYCARLVSQRPADFFGVFLQTLVIPSSRPTPFSGNHRREDTCLW